MATLSSSSRTQLHSDIFRILRRHLLSIVNLVMGSVILLLVWFGEGRDALFISSVLTINILLGLFQEIRARLTLEKLRAKLSGQVRLVESDGVTRPVTYAEIAPGDTIELRRGDTVGVDGTLRSSSGLELSEAFLTGESASIPKQIGDTISAGSWVVAGHGRVQVQAVGEQTRSGGMHRLLRRYRPHASPIERGLATLITVLTYTLIFSAIGLILQQRVDVLGGEHPVRLVTQIAALTATIVPEGLVLASTVLFAYGALQMMRRRVIMQRLSAVEILARVQVLCLDKTGTLTEGKLRLTRIEPAPGTTKLALQTALASYLQITEPEGELASVTPWLKLAKAGETVVAFSSHRRYGEVQIGRSPLRVGTPEVLALDLKAADKKWLSEHSQASAEAGERCLAVVGQGRQGKKLFGIVGYAQPLRSSARDTLRFFRERAVAVKILSGDHPATVRAIAHQLGFELGSAQKGGSRRVITGKDLDGRSSAELTELMRSHSLFARLTPEDKSALIIAAKKLGSVGMVGDGANDALAIKQADMGISMLDAADVTRTLADAVLAENKFDHLPRGVQVADAVITTLELIGCLFLNKVVIGLTLVALCLFTNANYPLTPRNITVLNYFIIGIPIILWTYFPRTRQRSPHEPGYLKRIVPFVLANGLVAASITAASFLLASAAGIDIQMTLFLTTLSLGMGMLITAPHALGVENTSRYYLHVLFIGLASAGILAAIFMWPLVREFFGLDPLDASWLGLGAGLSAVGFGIQLLILKPHLIDALRRRLHLHT